MSVQSSHGCIITGNAAHNQFNIDALPRKPVA